MSISDDSHKPITGRFRQPCRRMTLSRHFAQEGQNQPARGQALVAKPVDASVSNTDSHRSEGSNPSRGTASARFTRRRLKSSDRTRFFGTSFPMLQPPLGIVVEEEKRSHPGPCKGTGEVFFSLLSNPAPHVWETSRTSAGRVGKSRPRPCSPNGRGISPRS